MKKTAIELLIEGMESLRNNKAYINPQNALNDCIHLAYANLPIEKEQIKEAFNSGNRLEVYDATETTSENYFNETYNK